MDTQQFSTIALAAPTVTLGPLAFSAGMLTLVAGVVVAFMIDGWRRRRGHTSAEPMLWLLLLLTLLSARAAFVWRWWPEYGAQPLSILNVRDGGLSAWFGLLILAAASGFIAWRRPLLRRALTWSVCGGVLVWGFASLTVHQLNVASSTPLPNITLHDLNGQAVPLREFQGKPTVINLWATWCGPCRREMPVLAHAQQSMPNVRFVFADQGESTAPVRDFLTSQKLQLNNVLIDDGMQLSQYYNGRAYPTTLFLDAHGHLRDMHMGELSAATLAQSIERITADASPHSGESL
ncbi:MAG: TlpA disulfide reductase family protein [Rhodanobacter sp.]